MNEFKYIALAHKLNQEHRQRLHSHKLHFRGNLNSMSLVSLHPDTPEIGIPGIRTERSALDRLRWVQEQEAPFTRGRSTPEKELQAWLIDNALSNDGRLFFDRGLKFLTSELALVDEAGRVVNDILALDEQDDLVVLELKTSRDLTRIEAQVRRFMACIAERRAFFSGLVELLTGRQWSGGMKGVVVWNASTQPVRKVDPAFREICFSLTRADKKATIDRDQHGHITFKELA